MLVFDYKLALYRRNNFGQPCVWYAQKSYDDNYIIVYHGIIGCKIHHEIIHTNRKLDDEIASRVNAKRKTGYKYLSEIKDNNTLPVEEHLHDYLDTYLPDNRSTSDGSVLPMLAKVYDNTNNKLFKNKGYLCQPKINGLRCFVRAERNNDLFKPYRLIFQSREGTYWNSLSTLEEYLLDNLIYTDIFNKMIEEHYILDGELYLPGYSVNQINHFVKNQNCAENKLLQYWCYDIAIEDVPQWKRLYQLSNNDTSKTINLIDKEKHLCNKEKFVVLPYIMINCDDCAVSYRNTFIGLGFEGLILREENGLYQFGKRNSTMIKFKKSTDGKFTIVDIYPEGIKRRNIPLFLLKNDINDETFEVHIGGSQSYQESFLNEEIKQQTIGKQMFVEYGERSGIKQVPFHVLKTYLL